MESAPEGLEDDPIVGPLLGEWRSRPEVLGAILGGSRGAGCSDDESDYDLTVVVTHDSGRPALGRPGGRVDLNYTSIASLEAAADTPGWWTAGYLDSRILLDKSGRIADALSRMGRLDPEKARADAAGWLDAYLNGFYRAMKAAKRGDSLGAHLHAAESMGSLVRALFALHRLWPPYHDRLRHRWARLDRLPWPTESLAAWVEKVVLTADPIAQRDLELRVEELMRAEGHAAVIDAWGDALGQARELPASPAARGRDQGQGPV